MRLYTGGLELNSCNMQVNDHLTRVGYSGKMSVVWCSVCAKDPELFGDAHFLTTTSRMKSGSIPCGCSKNPTWDESQYIVRINRNIEDTLPYKFVGWEGDFSGIHTKVVMKCAEHGRWCSSDIKEYCRSSPKCPSCEDYFVGGQRKPDSYHISKFMATGHYHADTVFSRTTEKTPWTGFRDRWNVTCGDCGVTYQTRSTRIYEGGRRCDCSNFRQKQIYLLDIYDGAQLIAVKFGIANDPKRRFQEIRRRSSLTIEMDSVWSFEDVRSCIDAENHIKKNFETRVISRARMESGWTETIGVLDKGNLISYLKTVATRTSHYG